MVQRNGVSATSRTPATSTVRAYCFVVAIGLFAPSWVRYRPD
jgi:hypothetical protein